MCRTDIETLTTRLTSSEPLITPARRPQLRRLLYKLLEKQIDGEAREYYVFRVLRAHILPLTNCTFNKGGDKFITGSYDRTAKIWDTATGGELLTLEGHRNVVYAIGFNNPYGDKVVTGSFDRTAMLWDAVTGECHHTYRGVCDRREGSVSPWACQCTCCFVDGAQRGRALQ